MKITNIRTSAFQHEMSRAIGDANNPRGRSLYAGLAVFLHTDAGLTGMALGNPGQAWAIESMARELLFGQDPRGVIGLWQRMADFAFKGGNRGAITDVIGTLDVALWDLKAKANGQPLWQCLGASSPTVRAYASGIDLCLSDEEIGAFYQKQAARGIYAGKLKVGLDREHDLRRISIMRDALASAGKTPLLMIDSNEYWSPKQAIQHIRYFERHYELFWAEEPARRWDVAGLRKVSDAVNAAVATGENLDDAADFRPLIAARAADILQIGVGTGGITGAWRVAQMADGFDLPVSVMNCPGNFLAHFAAVLPNHIWMEVVDAGRDVVFTHDSRVEDGHIVLGDSPGNGISFDEAKLAQYKVGAAAAEASPSPWGRRVGAGLVVVGEEG
ncbi:MAG: mandelate racemase/muconate lactonizing enzyme family protein [Chloroflexi bacterium]|nr:mandelate racemase/muconate lactonizing enzyme family protein [Chloroflexota bacterium]MDE2650177.1 mandelate racemase/muconate lactonizing enzyme family protein [Chloroflexota bacterium]MXX49717.1 mandelate racemase/muconate lactonizing enzyme family protein [Chloroflexota bacterium]MYC55718.1 mandelate racemase/muconate lactonizing enzyme family protein [Chloroflexota bacterium]MYE79130.1 mandelate racemase/muconate lactonizing enzyme family protein [Chloroflexota bacterium]